MDPTDSRPRRVTSAKHLADLAGSGLTQETWEAAGVYSEHDPHAIGRLLGWDRPAKTLGAAIVFPYFGLGGESLNYHRLKPDHPRTESAGDRNGKITKYEAPRGQPVHAYFPPALRQSWPTAEFVILTEGEKKTLAACQHGFPTIGLSGVWCWSSSKKLLPELAAIDWTGRRVFIAFDSDRATNKNVRRAETDLAAELGERGALVRLVELPPGPNGDKTGLDDFFVRGGTNQEFQALLDRAIVPPGRRPKVMGEQTDTGNACEFARDHGLDVHWTMARDWLVWDGHRWKVDDTLAVVERAKVTARRLIDEALCEFGQAVRLGQDDGAKKKASARLKHAEYTRHKKGLDPMLALARSIPGIATIYDQFDRHPHLFNVTNGTIDLRTGKLRPHDRADLITRLAPVAYDPNADAPTWDRFLCTVFAGDLELIGWLQRWAGYCLTGDTREAILPVLWGGGANGKSTFTETFLELAGDYGHKANSEMLLLSKTDRHPTERAALCGKRFVAATESGESRRLNEPLVKELTGGDRVRAHFMRKDEFEFASTFKIALSTNHRPRITGTDHAIWRRLRLIPFTRRFWRPPETPGPPELRADPEMKAKLRAELPGILTWAVHGAIEFYAHGLGTCRAVEAATAEYRESEDIVSQFVAERCNCDRRARVKAGDLYKAYRAWSEGRGEFVISQTLFGSRMTDAGFERRKTDGYIHYLGVELLPESFS
jgi:putative DNA primase/helicase